jgi:hypothetical protein
MDPSNLFASLIGKWHGTSQTWFEPNKLADESDVDGEFTAGLMPCFITHTYSGTMQGKPRQGQEQLAFNAVTERYQIVWMDTFHMNYAIQFSQGEGTERGFRVLGTYDVGKDSPAWGWQTEYELVDPNRLDITAYNVTPDGQSAKAIALKYVRAEIRSSL